MPSKELQRDTPCAKCGKQINQGTYLDDLSWDQETKKWSHRTHSPTVATSIGQGESPAGNPGPGPGAIPPVDSLFVFVGAYVPIRGVHLVTDAIMLALGGK